MSLYSNLLWQQGFIQYKALAVPLIRPHKVTQIYIYIKSHMKYAHDNYEPHLKVTCTFTNWYFTPHEHCMILPALCISGASVTTIIIALAPHCGVLQTTV